MLRQLYRDLKAGVWLKNTLQSSGTGATPVNSAYEKTVIVEFSSPNIAKPFHVGHLRSTLLGNFISGILKATGIQVSKINYLGDWGTQFGILTRGFERFGDWKCLEGSTEVAIGHLFQVYVEANKLASSDENFRNEAKEIFCQMEEGQDKALRLWEMASKISRQEFLTVYRKLGIEFDRWDLESTAWKESKKLMTQWETEGKIVSSQGAKGVINPANQKFILLEKQDGSTLYLTRDLATAIERNRTFQPGAIVYVVEHGQREHFQKMKAAFSVLGEGELASKILHVPFGRIQGMSTRKGQSVFVNDVFNDGIERVKADIFTSKTVRVTEADYEDTAQELANSALLAYDAKRRRSQDYKFSWDEALRMKGDTGVNLQSTHARLCSLVENGREEFGRELPSPPVEEAVLVEPEAKAVLHMLVEAERAFRSAYLQLEPCHLVQYLFKLSHLTGTAKVTLRVSQSPPPIALSRLLLFEACRDIMGLGMRTLGMKPLNKV